MPKLTQPQLHVLCLIGERHFRRADLFRKGQGWAGTPIAETNRARVLACLWLAHEAEEEG